MTWDKILVCIAGIIAAFGGAGGIIIAVSKWLGNIMADSLQKKQQAKYDKELENIKQQYQKEIETYKNELQIVCENVKRDNAQIIYVTEKQFDIEIDLFQQLTEKAFVLELRAKVLFAVVDKLPIDEGKRHELEELRYKEFVEANNAFIDVLGKSRAFIDLEIYDSYVAFYNICQQQNFWYMEKVFNHAIIEEKDLSDCYQRSIKIEQVNAATSLLIKTYLAKLKIARQ